MHAYFNESQMSRWWWHLQQQCIQWRTIHGLQLATLKPCVTRMLCCVVSPVMSSNCVHSTLSLSIETLKNPRLVWGQKKSKNLHHSAAQELKQKVSMMISFQRSEVCCWSAWCLISAKSFWCLCIIVLNRCNIYRSWYQESYTLDTKVFSNFDTRET